MASDNNYLNYVLELLKDVENVGYRKMMGEYLLYKDGILFGGIYDNRFLIKIAPSLKKYNFKEEIPYPNAKSMYLIDVEDSRLIKGIIDDLFKDI